MSVTKVINNIYWVGAIDWDLRNFHGYVTERGSTYNAYLIMDEKITLVDTVKSYLCDQMMENIKKIVDPSKIDYVISNHTEMDHSGSLPTIMAIAKNATLICSPSGEKGLKKHFNGDWKYKTVKSGEVLNTGKHNLSFILCPMVHWPDSMVTYIADEKILLSNDGFGQHIASYERFDDEFELGIIKEEAAKYYANIVLPYGAQVKKLLDQASSLDIEIIAPSHGLIWRKNVKEIVSLYSKWSANQYEEKAVIVYGTMWGSTKKLAYALSEVFTEAGIANKLRNLDTNHISNIMAEVLTSKYICVGSSTLNSGLLPSVASFLTYLKGLAPKNRVGIAFGSYGWGGQSIPEIESMMESCNFMVPVKGLKIQYIPREAEIEEFKDKVKNVLK